MAYDDLRSALNAMASTFVDGVLAAIRSVSLQDLLAESRADSPLPRGSRPPAPAPPPPFDAAGKSSRRRLARRSEADVMSAVTRVVATIRKSKAPMSSGQIKKSLGLDPRELPRILRMGVESKKLKSTGKKRGTTYTAA